MGRCKKAVAQLQKAIDIIDRIVRAVKNCGAGAPGSQGFQTGNTCAGGGGGSGSRGRVSPDSEFHEIGKMGSEFNLADTHNVVQFHGTQNTEKLISAIEAGESLSGTGKFGDGFYLTPWVKGASFWSTQQSGGEGREQKDLGVVAIDTRDLKIFSVVPEDMGLEYDDNPGAVQKLGFTDVDKLNDSLAKKGYDAVYWPEEMVTVVLRPEKLKIADESILLDVKRSPAVKKKKSRSDKNCGAGAPGSQGFQPGNTCAGGGGGGAGGGNGGSSQEDPGAYRTTQADNLSESMLGNGGFTYQPLKNYSPTSGFAVSVFRDKEVILDSAKEVTPLAIASYWAANQKMFEDSSLHIGGWFNEKTEKNPDGDNKYYLDVIKVVHDQSKAVSLAKKHGQLGIFNLASYETIKTMTAKEREDWEREQGHRKETKSVDGSGESAESSRDFDRFGQADERPRADSGRAG